MCFFTPIIGVSGDNDSLQMYVCLSVRSMFVYKCSCECICGVFFVCLSRMEMTEEEQAELDRIPESDSITMSSDLLGVIDEHMSSSGRILFVVCLLCFFWLEIIESECCSLILRSGFVC